MTWKKDKRYANEPNGQKWHEKKDKRRNRYLKLN